MCVLDLSNFMIVCIPRNAAGISQTYSRYILFYNNISLQRMLWCETCNEINTNVVSAHKFFLVQDLVFTEFQYTVFVFHYT